jgi:hypothetical protein
MNGIIEGSVRQEMLRRYWRRYTQRCQAIGMAQNYISRLPPIVFPDFFPECVPPDQRLAVTLADVDLRRHALNV